MNDDDGWSTVAKGKGRGKNSKRTTVDSNGHSTANSTTNESSENERPDYADGAFTPSTGGTKSRNSNVPASDSDWAVV